MKIPPNAATRNSAIASWAISGNPTVKYAYISKVKAAADRYPCSIASQAGGCGLPLTRIPPLPSHLEPKLFAARCRFHHQQWFHCNSHRSAFQEAGRFLWPKAPTLNDPKGNRGSDNTTPKFISTDIWLYSFNKAQKYSVHPRARPGSTTQGFDVCPISLHDLNLEVEQCLGVS